MSEMRGAQFPIYLRREPSADPSAPLYGARRAHDVVAYFKSAGTMPYVRWHWNASDKPRKGPRQSELIMLNCFQWRIIWLPDVVEDSK